MVRRSTRVGDVFSIPLSDGRCAYGQYVHRDTRMGPLVRVYDLVTRSPSSAAQILRDLRTSGLMFPPIFVGVGAAVRTEMWKVLGRLPVDDFVYPGFLRVYHERYVPYGSWVLWDGQTDELLGEQLPEYLGDLELLIVWSPLDVVSRIETGENPYGDMVRRAALGEDSS